MSQECKSFRDMRGAVEAHVNWRYGPGQIRTGIGLRRAARRQDVVAGRSGCECSEPGNKAINGFEAERSTPAFPPCENRSHLPAHTRCANREGRQPSGKEFSGETACAIFERGVAAGVGRVLRPGCSDYG